jgi:hypothetical protein
MQGTLDVKFGKDLSMDELLQINGGGRTPSRLATYARTPASRFLGPVGITIGIWIGAYELGEAVGRTVANWQNRRK